jgi:hypothetical protein
MTGCLGDAPVPRVADTDATRTAAGRNTAWPAASVPVCGTPSAAWSPSSADAVAEVKWARELTLVEDS